MGIGDLINLKRNFFQKISLKILKEKFWKFYIDCNIHS